MKVNVDPDRCEGHARCWEICPEVFWPDDAGHATVVSDFLPAGLEAETAKAASNCPEGALTAS